MGKLSVAILDLGYKVLWCGSTTKEIPSHPAQSVAWLFPCKSRPHPLAKVKLLVIMQLCLLASLCMSVILQYWWS
jgi:hypothetical protein